MYLIGIDISKYKHNCFIATEADVVIKEFVFDNNSTGFKEFLDVLKLLDQSKEIRIGLESTGHYGNNLKHFITASGFTYLEFNPLKVHYFALASSPQRAKTDKIDARLISKMLGSVDYKTLHSRFYHINELKELTRQRDNLITGRSRCLVSLTTHLDSYFPEFKPFFNNKFSETSLFILKTFKTRNKISNLTNIHFEKLRCLSKGKFTYPKFRTLKSLAANSVGLPSNSKEFLITLDIKRYYNLVLEIEELESKILSLMSNIDTKLKTIKNFSVFSIATIIGEIGNIDRFNSPEKLIAYAGLSISVSQSGLVEHRGKIVKRGSSLLRKTIWNLALPSVKLMPIMNDYYHKKRLEGKHHKVALTQICRKLLRMIYKIESSNVDFNLYTQ